MKSIWKEFIMKENRNMDCNILKQINKYYNELI